jgi:Zn-dependent protease
MENPQYILMIPVLLFSLSLHEYAHALAAKWAGDDTAARLGRLTLNPLAHIDPVGTVIVPVICLVRAMTGGGGFFFGWAKPVPVNPDRFKKRVWDAYVSGAGPCANFSLVILFTLILKMMYKIRFLFSDFVSGDAGEALAMLFVQFIALNVLLGLFNLIPIPPLDGSHIFFHFFVRPHTQDHVMFKLFAFLEHYGFLLLIFLLFALPYEKNPFYLVYNKSITLIFRFIFA